MSQNYCLVSLLFSISKFFEILVDNTLVDPLKQCGLSSSMISGLPNQLQIFSQLYLIEMIGLLIFIGLIELWHLIYPRLSTRSHLLVFFTNSSL